MTKDSNTLRQVVIALVIFGIVAAIAVMNFFKKYAPEVVEIPPSEIKTPPGIANSPTFNFFSSLRWVI